MLPDENSSEKNEEQAASGRNASPVYELFVLGELLGISTIIVFNPLIIILKILTILIYKLGMLCYIKKFSQIIEI